ncbi:MAG: acyltransferase [Clostridiales bacterium]|nr:acyltransferase [Clostridiales bacterium]
MEQLQKKERNPGIELFRCVSMIMIILLHVTSQGGVLGATATSSASYYAAYFLKVIGYCAVDCYAVISGYVNSSKSFRFKRIGSMWLEVVFWLAVPAIITHFFLPQFPVSQEKWIEAFFPVSTKAYWYFNAYIILFALMPILNKGLESLSEKQHRIILLFLFGVVTVLPFVGGSDLFATSSGYSGIWLVILFVFGAYFRIHGIPKFAKWYVTIPVFFLSATASWALDLLRMDLYNHGMVTSSDLLYKSLDRALSYISPFMVLMALSLLCFFAQVKINPKPIRKILEVMGRATFGVYLFHVGDMIWVNWFKNSFKDYGKLPAGLLVLSVIGISILLFISWDILSIGRIYLFKLIALPFSKIKKKKLSEPTSEPPKENKDAG